MQWIMIVGWAGAALIALLILYAIHRLALRLEERGLIYYWHKKPETGSASAWMPLQELVEPQVRHVIELEDRCNVQAERNAQLKLDIEAWERIEFHLQGLPGGTAFCENVRDGHSPWRAIGSAALRCNAFPAEDFATLLSQGDFDCRWPLSFAAWHWKTSGVSVDNACIGFLASAGLSEQVDRLLSEYRDKSDWLSEWHERFRKLWTASGSDR